MSETKKREGDGVNLRRSHSDLVFTEEPHSYHFRGRQVPSITGVIEATGNSEAGYAFVDPATMEFARERGSAVDLAIQLWIEGDLDEATLDPIVVPYLNAYRRFVDETGWRTLALQPRVYDPETRIAATPDEVGWLHGRRTLCEWKATVPLPKSITLQVGGCAAAWDATFPAEKLAQARGIQLRSDGTYRLHPIDLGVWGPQYRRMAGEFWRAR